MDFSDRRKLFRHYLTGGRCLFPASVFDPVSVRLAESCGYEIAMLAGSMASATVLGAPDLVVLTLSEFAEQARRITRAANVPLMVDADHGYGNALSVMRTVEELENAGVAALTIEDTRLPRQFRQGDKDEFISRDEFGGKLEAAVEARRDPGLVILGRTGVLPSMGEQEAAARLEVCTQSRVDAVFVAGVRSREQVNALCQMTSLPLVLGTIPEALQDRDLLIRNGVRIALQGHIPFRVLVHALQHAYRHLRAGEPPAGLEADAAAADLTSRLLGQERYRAWTEKYLK